MWLVAAYALSLPAALPQSRSQSKLPMPQSQPLPMRPWQSQLPSESLPMRQSQSQWPSQPPPMRQSPPPMPQSPLPLRPLQSLPLPLTVASRRSTAASCQAVKVAPLALPAPGAYPLQRILKAPDGLVLDSDGKAYRLAEFTTGKITLFSFIYTYCTDAKGCPLAYETLHGLKKTLTADKALRKRIRFVSMSFDPRNDTPIAMKSYGGQDARDKEGLRWHFLTSRSAADLAPMLDGFGQDVSVALEPPPGRRVPILSHLLKVYLLDQGGTVREIYSTSFLNQNVLLNDIKTLLLEADKQRR